MSQSQKLKIGYIYVIENNFDDKVYIGLTTKTIKERFAQHVQAANSERGRNTILHHFMAKHGPHNFTVRELRRVEYTSLIELQLVEEECIKDFGNLNTTYNRRSGEMDGIKMDKVIQDKKQKTVERLSYSSLPSSEEILRIAFEAEEIPNKKISLNTFIDLFIEPEYNVGNILNSLKVVNNTVHMSRPILEWFGYEGEESDQRKSFKRLLSRNNVPYKEIAHNDPEAQHYPTIAEEAALLPHNAARSRQRFIIMNARDIKEAVMMLNTKTAKIVRNYYLDLEDLVKEYACYTTCFRERQLHLKDDRIDELMNQLKTMNIKSEEMNIRAEQRAIKQDEKIDEVLEQNEELKLNIKDVKAKLGIACVERAPLPEKSSKQERFLLLKRNDDD